MSNNGKNKEWLTPTQRLVIALYVVTIAGMCIFWVPWVGTGPYRVALGYSPIWATPGTERAIVDTTRITLEIFVATVVFGAILFLFRNIKPPWRTRLGRTIVIALLIVVAGGGAMALLAHYEVFLSRQERAQKLFDLQKYQEIVRKYPDLPIARQAKDRIAENLLVQGKYEEILANYSDTPSAAEATNKIAENLEKAGKLKLTLAAGEKLAEDMKRKHHKP